MVAAALRRSALLASQVPVDRWHDVVGDPTFGDANGPPLLQGGRHHLEYAIGLAESVVGIAGMGTAWSFLWNTQVS